MSEPKRLHPVAAVSNVLTELKNMFFPLIIVLFVNKGEKNDIWDYIPIIVTAAAILFVLVSGVIKWLRFTYRVEAGELRIEYGLFVKKKRYIPIERIQSVDVSEGPLQQAFNLVKINIETAGSSANADSEAELTAITKEEAAALEEIINREKSKEYREEMDQDLPDSANADRDPATVLYQAKLSDLLLLAATSGGAGVVISAVVAFLSQFSEFIPYEKVFKEASHLLESGVVFVSMLVVAVLFLAWLISVILTLLKYYNFTVEMTEQDIVIKRGLLEKRQTTIPLSRVQGIVMVENPLRQLIGYSCVQVESAGGSAAEEGGTSFNILPMVKKWEAFQLLENMFKDYSFPQQFHPAPKRAARRYMLRKSLYVLVPIMALSGFFWPHGLWSLLLLLLAAFYGMSCYRAAGWTIQDQQLSLRYRLFSRCTVFLKKSRIQSADLVQTYWQANKQLATIEAVIKSGEGGRKTKMVDAERADAEKMYHWYQRNQSETQVKE
ncbi:PH domain-containing protein [Bacillus xiapuensis]|uniref:PH domain-containing protein n=1 Tax=Bacillus xiapuensis TaxID=2014075 RepID=UPI000C24AAE3|nr:PH domain-containing protein [Bacillus xiapuensis]